MSPYPNHTLSERTRSLAETRAADVQIGAFVAGLTRSLDRMRRFTIRLTGRGRRSPSLAAKAGPAPAAELLRRAARGRSS